MWSVDPRCRSGWVECRRRMNVAWSCLNLGPNSLDLASSLLRQIKNTIQCMIMDGSEVNTFSWSDVWIGLSKTLRPCAFLGCSARSKSGDLVRSSNRESPTRRVTQWLFLSDCITGLSSLLASGCAICCFSRRDKGVPKDKDKGIHVRL